jgi:hypothetical protein
MVYFIFSKTILRLENDTLPYRELQLYSNKR